MPAHWGVAQAGRFGGAYDVKALTVADGTQWEARATGSVGAYRSTKGLLDQLIRSFRVK